MPAVKITQKPIGTPGDDTHFIVTQPELPEGYTPTGQETEEELAELKVESVREIEMDDMVELIQEKLDMDVTPTTGSSKPVTSGGIKAALDLMDDDISSLNEDITNLQTDKQDALTFDQTPTAESTNPVTSVGIKNAIEAAVDVTAPGIYETASGSIASFSDGADDMPLKSCVVNLEPIQEGTGDPSPENVRPISGRTGLSVVRCGKNLVNCPDVVNKTITNYYFDSIKIGFVLKPNITYTFSAEAESTVEPFNCSVGIGSSSVYIIDLASKNTNNNGKISITFTPAETQLSRGNVLWVRFVRYTSPTTYTYSLKNMQLEFGSTATDYEPYKGSTYSVNWETEAGSVYGGTLDVVSGKLVIDRVSVVYDGSSDENWARYKIGSAGTFAMSVNITDIKLAKLNEIVVMSNEFIAVAPNATWGSNYSFITTQSGSNILVTGIKSITTVADWRAYLATSPLQVIYKLNTPTEIQLTPQEVRTLLGVNNIWSDGGDVEVEYPADTKMYIDTKIAEAVAAAMA